jgi:hypothetical protein
LLVFAALRTVFLVVCTELGSVECTAERNIVASSIPRQRYILRPFHTALYRTFQLYRYCTGRNSTGTLFCTGTYQP